MNFPRFAATFSLLAVFSMTSQFAGAAENFDIDSAVQNAQTKSDHESVAKYYEDAAKEARVKATEQQALLEEYENKGYLYGRNAEDMKARASAAVHKYEKAAQASSKEAALHRQLAAELDDGSGKPDGKAFSVAK
jgi:plasmid replication initiation protein